MPTDNPNILFKLSGVTQGLYVFEQNPLSMDIYSPKQEVTILNTLAGENIYQRNLFDNQIRILKWDRAMFSLYASLKTFTIRDSNGNIPVSYFWDGTVKEFQGAAIQVIDVYARPIASEDRWSIDLQFKPSTVFDKEYATNRVLGYGG